MDEYSASRFEPERQLARPSCRNFVIQQYYYDEEYNASRVLGDNKERKLQYRGIDDEEEKKKKKKKKDSNQWLVLAASASIIIIILT